MTIWNPTDDGHADLSSHDSFVAGVPHNTFTRMRRESPLEWTEWKGGEGFWNVTRHKDILALNRNYALLSSAQGIRMEDQTYEEYLARRTFQETDPPEHTRVRMKVARAFSGPVIARFESQIRQLCRDILERALAKSEFDATREIARQLPMRMLGRILGLPDADLEWLVSKGDELIANTDPEFTDHVLDRMSSDEYRMMPFNSPAGAELYAYARQLMEEKNRAGDTGGILHMVLQPDESGSAISDREFRNFFCLLVAAGNDTTRYSIAAALHAMCRKPELLQQLKRADDGIWSTATDEFVRWASPTMYFRRTATEDFEMHGKEVRANQKVLLWFVSGNRDERQFDDPFNLDLRRSPNRHVAFGQGGPHVCLGIWLARLELKVLLQEFTKRVAAIEANGPHRFLRSNFIGGIKSLPVRISRA
ncbi:MAG: cytochrome P450 [Rhodobacteraceae bacterium]|nr:cytochrome P450 [Paracoccaceae bacterium]